MTQFKTYNMIWLLTLFCFLSISCEKEETNPPSQPLHYDLGIPFSDSNMQDWLNHYNIPGLCMAVIEYDSIVWIKGYGLKDNNSKDRVNEKTIFQAASISKPVATIIAMHVYNQYNINLDVDINGYLSQWKIPLNEYNSQNRTTIRQLLSHTGGTNVHGFAGYNAKKKIPSLLEILNGNGSANNSSIIVEYEPASKYQYSGGGFEIIQLSLEEIYGKKFEEIAKEVLFDTLDLQMSSYYIPKQKDNTALGHLSNRKVVDGKWNIYPELCAAGLWTNVEDLSKVIIDFQKTNRNVSNNVLTKDLTEQILKSQIKIPDSKKYMGLGFVLTNDGTNDYFEHSGSNNGYKCYLMGYFNLPFGIIIMTNSDNGDKIFQDIIDAVFEAY